MNTYTCTPNTNATKCRRKYDEKIDSKEVTHFSRKYNICNIMYLCSMYSVYYISHTYVYEALWTERGNNYYIVYLHHRKHHNDTRNIFFPIQSSIRPDLYDENEFKLSSQHSRCAVQSTFTFYKSVLDHARQVHVLSHLRRLWEPNTPKSDRLCFFFYRLLLFLSVMPIYAYARSTKQGASYVCVLYRMLLYCTRIMTVHCRAPQ